MKYITKFLYWSLLVILILIAGGAALAALPLPGGLRAYSVYSGSMMPAIKVGSVIIIKPSPNYKVGDIITYKSERERNTSKPIDTVTHRIFSIEEIQNSKRYITKGDANQQPDTTPVDVGLILGKAEFVIPWLGYPIGFARTQIGLIVLVIIPATIIVYNELMHIKNEAKKLISDRKRRKLNTIEKLEVEIGKEEIKIGKEIKRVLPLLIGIITCLCLVHTPLTKSYFSDLSNLSENKFEMGRWGPEISMNYDHKKHCFGFKLKHLSGFKHLKYTLTYTSKGIPKGMVGEEKFNDFEFEKKDLFAGTCSGDNCTFDEEIKNIKVEVQLTDINSGTRTIEGSL